MLRVLVLLLGCVLALGAGAKEVGQWSLRTGIANVSPQSSSDGIAIPALGIEPIAGTEAEPHLNSQLGLTVTYMFTSKIGLEVLASTPFKHEITADLDGYSPGLRVDAGEVKQLPPTVSALYYPMGDKVSAFQPYVGLGLNYTLFFSEEAHPDLEALTGTLAGTPGPVPLDLKVDDSWGVAVQVGFDYALNEKWSLNGAVRWIDIDTDAVFRSDLGDTITVDNIEIDPVVYQLTLGFAL